ncbi:M1 family metallopeptidase [Streptomyces daghestanicus]|uniref:Aminopeptidase N n=1 Tax=Streptomyces daghestanicus TaxID=66885 RepID=A0ABQ3Q4K8_9ACTN|nr:M1 family metallopeptidase [Streptomyces daghestanicus]GGU20165.1 metallopeptidase [Streptomyces daghestanicus]GHI32206.1 metallopeptidase [Streptomyces daghestanicus]
MRTPRPPAVVTAAVLTALTACGGVHGTPGGSGVRDPYFPKAGNGGYDVTHYDLDLAYDPARHRLAGTATVTARATEDLSAFDLDLKGLDVGAVTVDGRAARFNRAGQELTVRPPDDLDDGDTFRVAVRYSGAPETITDPDGSDEGWLRTDDGALALGQPVGSMAWFPGNHHPSDKATYTLTVTVPEGLRAVSNGEPTGERTARGRTTVTWRTTEPMASYLATVAVGDWRVTRSRARDGLPVYTAVDPAQAAASEAVLKRIPEVVAWAEDLFGPYPFSSVGAIVDRPTDVGYALETQTRPVFPGAPDTVLLVHELAHQWYGDSVTPRTWRDMWLNEGFATYAEWLWQEDHGGDTAQETFDALYAGRYFAGTAANEAVWAFPPADPPDAAHLTAAPVYQRGAMVLHKIRQRAGDAAFRALLRGWAAEHRHGTADTGDFTAYVEKRLPDEDLTDVWEDWLRGDGRPDRP